MFFIVPVGRGVTSGGPDPGCYETIIRDVLQNTRNSGVSVRPTCAPQFMRIAKEIGVDYPATQKGCLAGICYCRICPDGEVTPCPYLPVSAGNVRTTPFIDIWNHSPVFESLEIPEPYAGNAAGANILLFVAAAVRGLTACSPGHATGAGNLPSRPILTGITLRKTRYARIFQAGPIADE